MGKCLTLRVNAADHSHFRSAKVRSSKVGRHAFQYCHRSLTDLLLPEASISTRTSGRDPTTFEVCWVQPISGSEQVVEVKNY